MPTVRPGDWIRFRQERSMRLVVVLDVRPDRTNPARLVAITRRGAVPVERIAEVRPPQSRRAG